MILSAEKVVLPGVGAFGDAMISFTVLALSIPFTMLWINKISLFRHLPWIAAYVFREREESPGVAGLGLLKGEIVKIPPVDSLKIPHMGWNSIDLRPGTKLFRGIDPGSYVYFVHSYYLKAEHEEDVAAKTFYGVEIHAAVEHENLFACQFHPEKSSEVGLNILKNLHRYRRRLCLQRESFPAWMSMAGEL